MNERIKELAELSIKESGQEFWWLTNDLVIEKFAQLIVRQCVEVCLDRHDTWSWDDEPDSDSGPRDCAQSIKQHFGVEQ